MSRKHIIVAGGYGFVGSRFVKYLIENTDYNVVIIDNKTDSADTNRISSWFDPVKHHGRIVHCIENIAYSDLNKKVGGWFTKASYVVNFASDTNSNNMGDIVKMNDLLKTNVRGAVNLVETCRDEAQQLEGFVQVSTSEVYGDMEPIKRSGRGAAESFPLYPSSYYAAAKASADLLVQSLGRGYNIPFIITRSCSNFGPGQSKDKLVPKIVECIKNGEPIPIYGRGQHIREWINVDQHVEYIYQLMTKAPKNEIYNIGSGYRSANLSIVHTSEFILGKPVEFEFVDNPPGHDKLHYLDSNKLHSAIPSLEFSYDDLESYLEFELMPCNMAI